VFIWKVGNYKKNPELCTSIERYSRGRKDLPEDLEKTMSIVSDLAIFAVIKIIQNMESYQ